MIGDGIMTVLGLQTKSIQLYAYGVILLSISVSHLIAQDGVPPAVAETPGPETRVEKPGVTSFGGISVVGSRQVIREVLPPSRTR